MADRFTITRFLGEGGMATVFVAEQDAEPREVALKIMNEELTADRSFVKRFQREAKAAAHVQHPNSVAFIDYGVADGISYIAMELLQGDDLYVVLEREGALSQARAARIVIEVCEALAVAHDLGIVHRDLKPENIMVIPDPAGERVKVLDFGIAKLVAPDTQPANHRIDPSSGVTRAGTFIGTPAYMSPEQCGLLAVDTRADIYTCGVLLFQMTTGRLPFEGQTPLHTATLHIHEAPPRPSTFSPGIDARLEALILKALAKAPADRHQTALELARDLRTLLRDLPDVRVTGASVPPSAGTPRGRTRNGGSDTMSRAPISSDPLESAKTMVADEGNVNGPTSLGPRTAARASPPSSEPITAPNPGQPRVPRTAPRPAAGVPATGAPPAPRPRVERGEPVERVERVDPRAERTGLTRPAGSPAPLGGRVAPTSPATSPATRPAITPRTEDTRSIPTAPLPSLPALAADAPASRAPSSDNDDQMRTLVRAPTDEPTGDSRFGPRHTEVIVPGEVEAAEAAAAKAPTEKPAPARPRPAPKPTLKSAIDFKTETPSARAGSSFKLAEPAPAPASRASVASVKAPLSPDETSVTPIIAVGAGGLGAMRLGSGSAKLANTARTSEDLPEDLPKTAPVIPGDTRKIPPVPPPARVPSSFKVVKLDEPVDEVSVVPDSSVASVPLISPIASPMASPIAAAAPLPSPLTSARVPATLAMDAIAPADFGETTRMDAQEAVAQPTFSGVRSGIGTQALAPPPPGQQHPSPHASQAGSRSGNEALGVAATVPFIGPDRIQAVIASTPGAGPAAPASMRLPEVPIARATVPLLSGAIANAAAPPPTPPVYPLNAPLAPASTVNDARGLLLGFLAGAVVMAIVVMGYLLLFRR